MITKAAKIKDKVNINFTRFVKSEKDREAEETIDLIESFLDSKYVVTDDIYHNILDFLEVIHSNDNTNPDICFMSLISENKVMKTFKKKEFLIFDEYNRPFIFSNLYNMVIEDNGGVRLRNIESGDLMIMRVKRFLFRLANQEVYEKIYDLNGIIKFKALNKKDFIVTISDEAFKNLTNDKKFERLIKFALR